MKPSKYIKSDILNSVLNFAIEGKLVKQSSDTADDFIKLCKAKKSELKKIKSMRKLIDFDKPFDIPNNWRWEKLDNLILISTGASFKKEEALSSPKNGYVRVLRGGNVLNLDYSFFDSDLFIPKNLVSDDILLRKNDLISPSVTSIENIGKIACIKEKINNTTAGGFVFIFRPFVNDETFSELFSLFFSSPLFSATLKSITKKSGEAFYNLNKELLRNLWFPVPPLSEQEKIVKKFQQLKPLIDKYEELERERSDLNVKLKAQISKSILQYAMEGKLVEQRKDEGTGEELFNKIVFKQNKMITPILNEQIPFNVPKSWKWVRLGDISSSNIGLTYSPSDIVEEGGTIVLRSGNIQNNSISYENSIYVSCNIPDSAYIKKGDLLICARNGSRSLVGKCAIVDRNGCAFGAFMAKLSSPFVPFIKYFLSSPCFRKHLDNIGTETINQITQSNLKNQLIPLPPLKEQERIVLKIEKLMSITNQLTSE